MHRIVSLWPAASCLGLASALAALPPLPDTPRREVVEVHHGVTVTDPYRWLEGSADPAQLAADPGVDARVRAWSEAQNVRTRAYLDAQPGRAALTARLSELLRAESLSAPVVCGERRFYTRRKDTESNGVLFVREGADGPERELLNVNRLFPDGRTTLAYTVPSPDGKRLAYGLYKSGDEITTLYVIDVDTGRALDAPIANKAGWVSWQPGGEGFVYSRLADVNDPYSRLICHHRVGTDPATDRVIFEQPKTGPLARIGGPDATLDRSGRWLKLGYFRGWGRNDLRVCDFRHWLATGELRGPVIAEGRDAMYSGAIRGDTLYLFTTEEAPSGRLVAVDLANPDRARWRTLATGSPVRVLSGFSMAKDFLALCWSRDALREYELRRLDGSPERELALPGLGVASLQTDDLSNEAYLAYSAMNQPPTTYRVNLRTDERSVYFAQKFPVDPSRYVVERRFSVSKDGVRVPLFILHRRDLRLDGTAPTILWGYGGFSAAQRPGFSPSMLTWAEAGGVFVIAGLRGGDEYGEPWHRDGMLAKKQNVFNDYIGAAEYLIANKYTAPKHLGVKGGSNGGLLTGAMLTQRPDLIGAAQVSVPLLDMVRFPKFLMGNLWTPEYGDPSREADFRWIYEYSPYHRVKPGVAYPAVLLEAGEKDTRVHPLHARKMAALLQSVTGGDAAAHPVLLWVDFDSGHGAGQSFAMRVRGTVDSLVFFADNLGLRFPEAAPGPAAK